MESMATMARDRDRPNARGRRGACRWRDDELCPALLATARLPGEMIRDAHRLAAAVAGDIDRHGRPLPLGSTASRSKVPDRMFGSACHQSRPAWPSLTRRGLWNKVPCFAKPPRHVSIEDGPQRAPRRPRPSGRVYPRWAIRHESSWHAPSLRGEPLSAPRLDALDCLDGERLRRSPVRLVESNENLPAKFLKAILMRTAFLFHRTNSQARTSLKACSSDRHPPPTPLPAAPGSRAGRPAMPPGAAGASAPAVAGGRDRDP